MMQRESSKRDEAQWDGTEAPTQTHQQPARRPSASELREKRHLVAAVIASGVTLGFIIAIGVKLIAYMLTPPAPPGISQPPHLTEQIPPCGAGDTCGISAAQCVCEAPMECSDNSCTEPPKPPPICTDPEVKKLLKELSEKCQGNFDACPEDKLEEFALTSNTFEDTLSRFSSTVTIHFDNGTPPLDDKAWRDAAKEHYLARLDTERNRRLFAEAKVILLVSRSSPGRRRATKKQETANLIFSRERGRFTRILLEDLAGTIGAQSELGAKIKSLALGSRKVVLAEEFRERHGNQRITWNADTDRAYANGLKQYETLGGHQWWVDQITNQVTYIIPINCEIGEAGG